MPAPEELAALYEKLTVELGLNTDVTQKMSELSDESKWAMVVQHKKLQV
jgi:hypothetical protein